MSLLLGTPPQSTESTFIVVYRHCVCLRFFWSKSIDFLVSLVTAHLADSILEHHVLLEKVVYRHLTLSVVVHRAL